MSQSGIVLALGFLESQGKAPEAMGGGCFEVRGDILKKNNGSSTLLKNAANDCNQFMGNWATVIDNQHTSARTSNRRGSWVGSFKR